MEKINELRDEAYQIAVAHGWHEREYSDEHFLMLIVCELAEIVEADRQNRYADRKQYEWLADYAMRERYLTGGILEQYLKEAFESQIKDSVEDEFADTFIRCLDLAGLRGISLPERMTWRSSLANEFRTIHLPEWAYRTSKMVTSDRCNLEVKLHLVIFYILTMAEQLGIDLEWHVKEKVKYNRGREYKHGKRY